MRYIYSLLFYIALPFILLRVFWRGRKLPSYRQRILERFGYCQFQNATPVIWIHAVSFGEAKIATSLVQKLKAQHPTYVFIITTMTSTGSAHTQQFVDQRVLHFYAPYDLPTSIKRFLKRTKPKLLILIETEIWPNMIHYCNKNNIPIIIANARLSERSTRGYQRVKFFIKTLLQQITQVLAQTQADADRFVQIGFDAKKVSVAGNIKFAITPPMHIAYEAEQLRQQWGGQRPVLIVASTHPGEEEIVLNAFAAMRKELPDLLLLFVPRHPERFKPVANLCEKLGYRVALRSSKQIHLENIDIYLGDSMGEMWLFYAASDIAFVGGSLAPHGGHNLLEPAVLHLPIITGPHLFHFSAIAQLLTQANALTIVQDSSELANATINFLQSKTLQKEYGERAYEVVQKNQGALEKHLEYIKQQLDNLA
jgi:3-deoxy-D-manno-octulosonic-acid transferase